MLLRDLYPSNPHGLQPAFRAFTQVQSSVTPPCGLLMQSEHSRLAGAVAEQLLPNAFGPLNREVISAIAHHDDGWDGSDTEQIDALPKQPPKSFTAFNPEATLPSWIASIAKARQLGPLQEVLISRHCCLLGTGSGKHAGFVAEENARRSTLERELPYTAPDLDRWTAALGFCDLLSLYLCSGSKASVELPLAHPDAASNPPMVTLRWIAEQPRLSEPLLQDGCLLTAEGLCYTGRNTEPELLSLAWRF